MNVFNVIYLGNFSIKFSHIIVKVNFSVNNQTDFSIMIHDLEDENHITKYRNLFISA